MYPVPARQIVSTRLAKLFTLAAMSLGYGVVQLDVTIVNTALNSIGTSLGGAVAPTSSILIAARALQGVGAAILVPNSLALLTHAYGNETERGRAVGVWAAGASLALTAGPLIGGGLIEIAGWRSIFLVN